MRYVQYGVPITHRSQHLTCRAAHLARPTLLTRNSQVCRSLEHLVGSPSETGLVKCPSDPPPRLATSLIQNYTIKIGVVHLLYNLC